MSVVAKVSKKRDEDSDSDDTDDEVFKFKKKKKNKYRRRDEDSDDTDDEVFKFKKKKKKNRKRNEDSSDTDDEVFKFKTKKQNKYRRRDEDSSDTDSDEESSKLTIFGTKKKKKNKGFRSEVWENVVKPVGVGVASPIEGAGIAVGSVVLGAGAVVRGVAYGVFSAARGILGVVPVVVDYGVKPIVSVVDVGANGVGNTIGKVVDTRLVSLSNQPRCPHCRTIYKGNYSYCRECGAKRKKEPGIMEGIWSDRPIRSKLADSSRYAADTVLAPIPIEDDKSAATTNLRSPRSTTLEEPSSPTITMLPTRLRSRRFHHILHKYLPCVGTMCEPRKWFKPRKNGNSFSLGPL